MALTLKELDAYVHNDIRPQAEDTVYKNSPVLKRLEAKNREKFSGGRLIQQPLTIGELNGDFVGRNEGFNLDQVTTETATVNYMKQAYVNISLSGFDSLLDNGGNAVFNQVELKFANAARKMAKIIAVNMYQNETDTRSKYPTGFDQWYDDGNLFSTVGGITRTDLAANGTIGGLNCSVQNITTFQLANLNTMIGDAWFGTERIDMIPATLNAYNLIWEALQPKQQMLDHPSSDIGEAGFQGFRINGADVVVDKYMPAGTIFGLNTDYINLYYGEADLFQFGWTGWKPAPNTIDVVGQFIVAMEIVCPNPRTGGKIICANF